MRWLRFPRSLGIAAVVYLLAMAAVFALLTVQNSDFVRQAQQTPGTVVALVARAPLGSTREPRGDARMVSLAPKVSYTVAGKTYTYTAAHGRYRQRLQVGDTVTVLYAPDAPEMARLRDEGRAVGPLITIGFAAGAAAVLLVLLASRRAGDRRRRRPLVGAASGERAARGGRGVAD